MIQIVSKNGVDICVTSVPYHPSDVRTMKQAGYKIRNEESDDSMKRIASLIRIDHSDDENYYFLEEDYEGDEQIV